ncbi:MAG: hypothetical protein VX589_12900 [Myxococcota bacterium]|nr:hypothetical protein [Myxococcota bacterium]
MTDDENSGERIKRLQSRLMGLSCGILSVGLMESTEVSSLFKPVSIVIAQTWSGERLSEDQWVNVQVALGDREGLIVEVDAPLWRGQPPDQAAGRCWGLWQYDVVELFLVGQNGHYLEVEMGPHGHYLGLMLSAPRIIDDDQVPIQYAVTHHSSRWTGRARIAPRHLPEEPVRMNAFAIHGRGAQRCFMVAHALPGPQPNFHQPSVFPQIVELA